MISHSELVSASVLIKKNSEINSSLSLQEILAMNIPPYSSLKKHWYIDDQTVFLNHGSFGACPIPVLQKQDDYRKQMEMQPVKFMVRDLEELIWKSKETLAKFVGTAAEDLAFVSNATTGVNTILNSLEFGENDELLTTNHGYGACVNALKWFGEKRKAKVIVAEVPFPISSSDEVINALVSKISSRTKLVMIDYITSPTGLLFPVKKIVDACAERGIDCLVDGAHAPGQVPLNIDQLGTAYFSGTCHKWICSPKGAGFIHVRKDRQHLIHPITVSHTYDKTEHKERMWSSNFFWPGTSDYTSYVCVKDAIEFMGTLFPGGWHELMQTNRTLCLKARKTISEKTGLPLAAPEEMIVNLSAFDLGETDFPVSRFNHISPLWRKLLNEFNIELPVLPWNIEHPRLLLRFSAQCYNSIEQYEYLGEALKKSL